MKYLYILILQFLNVVRESTANIIPKESTFHFSVSNKSTSMGIGKGRGLESAVLAKYSATDLDECWRR